MLGDSDDLTLCVNESRYVDSGGLRQGVLVNDEVGQGWTGIPPTYGVQRWRIERNSGGLGSSMGYVWRSVS